MLLAMKIKAAITAAVLASPIALTIAPVAPVGDHTTASEMTEIAAKPFQYRLAGDFSRDGKPAEAPLRDALSRRQHQDHEPSGHRGRVRTLRR